MPTVAWPSVRLPRKYWFGQQPTVFENGSPDAGSAQTAEMLGIPWAVRMGWEMLSAADTARMRVFLAQMRGRAGRVYLWNMNFPLPQGTMRTGNVNGASQTGASIALNNCGNGATLKAGTDFIGIGGRLHLVAADVTANGSGQATVTIEPPIVTAPANGAAVTFDKPTALFRLVENTWAQEFGPPVRPRQSAGLELTFIEDLP